MRIAVVGATGLVGQKIIKILEERKFPVDVLIPVASEKSIGKEIKFKGNKVKILSFEDALAQKPEIAFFSAGGSTSLQWAEKFAAINCYVIDNSSAWRMNPNNKLIVPEVNGDTLNKEDYIIANPNCSTIQMVMALHPLEQNYGIKRVIVSTYQSVSGSGVKGINQLNDERSGNENEKCYAHPIDLNLIPQIDVFEENGYTKEEMKMILETQKILGNDTIQVSSTAVRVPVLGSHSESLNIELKKDFTVSEVKELFSKTKGLVVQDDISKSTYPMPVSTTGKDEVFIGRIRKDLFQKNTLDCWVVADNVRKGAALNAIQIGEYLQKKWFPNS